MHKETSISITKVTAENIEGFLGLIRKLAEYEKLTPPNEEAQNRLRKDCLSEKPRFWAYLACVDGQPAGYIMYYYTYSSFLASPTLYLEDFFVLETYRRQGVGKALFDFVKQTAKQQDCGRVEFTVLKWNKLAQGFYAKNKAENLDGWCIYRVVKDDF